MPCSRSGTGDAVVIVCEFSVVGSHGDAQEMSDHSPHVVESPLIAPRLTCHLVMLLRPGFRQSRMMSCVWPVPVTRFLGACDAVTFCILV